MNTLWIVIPWRRKNTHFAKSYGAVSDGEERFSGKGLIAPRNKNRLMYKGDELCGEENVEKNLLAVVPRRLKRKLMRAGRSVAQCSLLLFI